MFTNLLKRTAIIGEWGDRVPLPDQIAPEMLL